MPLRKGRDSWPKSVSTRFSPDPCWGRGDGHKTIRTSRQVGAGFFRERSRMIGPEQPKGGLRRRGGVDFLEPSHQLPAPGLAFHPSANGPIL
jgi:hypothetical protein